MKYYLPIGLLLILLVGVSLGIGFTYAQHYYPRIVLKEVVKVIPAKYIPPPPPEIIVEEKIVEVERIVKVARVYKHFKSGKQFKEVIGKAMGGSTLFWTPNCAYDALFLAEELSKATGFYLDTEFIPNKTHIVLKGYVQYPTSSFFIEAWAYDMYTGRFWKINWIKPPIGYDDYSKQTNSFNIPLPYNSEPVTKEAQ